MPAVVTTIASFPTPTTSGDGTAPDGQLFIDSSGNLIGATVHGGAKGIGATYEIAKVGAGYAGTPAFLADIPTGLNTLVGVPSLSADANGDLFGLEITGGGNSLGSVVEFPAGGGASITLPTVFAGGLGGSNPGGRLLVDAGGDLFGTTLFGGANNAGIVFEIKKTGGSYAASPTVLTSFASGVTPSGFGNLVEDAAGNLFGTTTTSVFEVKKTSGGYAAPVDLVFFAVGTQIGNLTIDARGDIFGTTANNGGTVFEIEKTPSGYASTPATLANFAPADGQLSLNRQKTLMMDANGDLFGTTDPSAQNSGGVVFEIARTSTGYERTPTIVVNFNGLADGSLGANLVADANGNLFATTQAGGVNNKGSAFEITESSFATTPTIPPIPPPSRSNFWVVTPNVLNNFSWAQGWNASPDYVRDVVPTNTNSSGGADYVGFGTNHVTIAAGESTPNGPGFANSTSPIDDFGTAQGYTAAAQRGAADTGNSGATGPTVYGQGFAGVYWYDTNGGTSTDPTYQSTPNLYPDFGTHEGWTPANGFDVVKGASTDTFASILGFGDAGIVVGPQAFNPSGSPSTSYVIPFAAGNNSGWDQTVDVRSFVDSNGQAIDLNHDGITDFVGMGSHGLEFAFGSDSGGHYSLGTLQSAQINGTKSDFGDAQGWNDSTTTRDIVKDPTTGFDDIIAFGAAGVYVSMGQDPSTHGGQPFGQKYLALNNFGTDQGWSNAKTPRLVGDVSGDGILDLVGFGANSTFTALGSHNSSGQLVFTMDPSATINDFGFNEGWSTSNTVRTLANVDGSGADSLVVSGASNTHTIKFG